MPSLTAPVPTRTYSQDEALEASRKYFNGDDLAASVWLNKYALKDSQGKLYEKTPADMHRRIAAELGPWKELAVYGEPAGYPVLQSGSG